MPDDPIISPDVPAPDDSSAEATATPDKPKPSLFLSDEQIDDAGLGDCQVGDSYNATVTLRVTGVNEAPDGGRSKSFDVDSITDVKPADEGAGEPEQEPDQEPEGNDSLGYDRPAAKEGMPLDLKKLRE